MNFFQSQDNARRKTRFLILMFMLAVIAIVAAVNLVITALIINVGDEAGGAVLPDFNWLIENRSLVAEISLVTIGFISLSSLYKIASLSSGGGKVARSLGGTLITAESKDPLRRRLYNVVEEMAIGESLNKLKIADGFFLIMQSKSEREQNKARFRIMKNRHGEVKLDVNFRTYYEKMKFEEG